MRDGWEGGEIYSTLMRKGLPRAIVNRGERGGYRLFDLSQPNLEGTGPMPAGHYETIQEAKDAAEKLIG